MRTAIYCRVSTPGQKNTTSLPEQERINRAYAAALGWQVSEPHVYREVEGGEDLYRPQMDRLWAAVEAHEVQAVVIDVLDRLSRDEGDQGAFYHHCDRYGVEIAIASEDIDDTEHGRNLRTLSGIMARMERVEIRRRTQRGRKARVAAGKMLAGAWPLYGYLWADPAKGQRSAYVADPETAPVVVRIYEMVADGVPLRRIADILEAEGVPTPGQILNERGLWPAGRSYSRIWRRGTIRRILLHPAYWGEHSAYRWQYTAEKVFSPETGTRHKVRRVIERPADDLARVVLPQTCPALVSRELAARVRARLAENLAENAGHNPDPLATIWRGLAICGHCGQRMYTAPPASDGYGRRYYCRSRRGASDGPVTPCPGGAFSISATVLDAAGWADVRA